MGMDATELARWTRFAAKGGIGKCVAVCDCVAESPDDLMFLKDDEITVLMQLPEQEGWFLGHCEGVVGRFQGPHVHFLTKLKKPVMTKRTSSISSRSATAKSPTPSSGGFKSPSPGPGQYSAVSVSGSISRRGSLAKRESDSLPRRGSTASQVQRMQGITQIPQTDDDPPSPNTAQQGAVAGGKSASSESTGGESTIDTLPPVLAFPVPPRSSSLILGREDRKRAWLEEAAGTATGAGAAGRGSEPPTREGTPLRVEVPMGESVKRVASPPTAAAEKTYTTPPPLIPSPFHREQAPSTRKADMSPLMITKRARPASPLMLPLGLVLEGARSPELVFVKEEKGQEGVERTHVGGLHSPEPVFARKQQVEGEYGSLSSGEQGHQQLQRQPQPEQPRVREPSPTSVSPSLTTAAVAPALPAPPHFPPPPVHPSPLPSALYPDTSISFASYDARVSLALSDGEVGIGLSLLQDLVGGEDSASASGSEYDDEGGEWGERERDSGMAEGLMYGDEEEGEDEGYGGDTTTSGENTMTSFDFGVGAGGSSHAGVSHSPPPDREPPPAPAAPSPAPSPPSPPPNTATFSPASPTFLHRRPTPERQPSLVPSIPTENEWEGADDIYDDYRYSRFSVGSKQSRMSVGSKVSVGSKMSVGSKASRFSVGSRLGSMGGQGQGGEAPPVPEARPSLDWDRRRPSVEVHQKQEPERETEIQLPKDPYAPTRRLPAERRFSVDSDASVYTQASRLSTLSKEVVDVMRASSSRDMNDSLGPSSATFLSSSSSTSTFALTLTTAAAGNRPAPLDLTHDRSPLLHTTWGSPVSSPNEGSVVSPASSSFYVTPIPGRVSSLTAVAGVAVPVHSVLANTNVGAGGAGMATALRQRIEDDRRSPVPTPPPTSPSPIYAPSRTSISNAGDGLGGRIVIEDEDELPSRILEDSREIHASPSPVSTPSPEPELKLLGMLGRGRAELVIANRTPEPEEEEEEEEEEEAEGEEKRAEEQMEVRREERFVEQPRVVAPSPSTSPPIPASMPPVIVLPAIATVQPSPLPSTSSSLDVPPPSHLRPSLADLRGGVQVVEGQRRSLFLPHPNAPKAPSASSPGPMYIASQQQLAQSPQQQQQQQQQLAHQQRAGPTRPTAIGVMHQALSTPPRGPPPTIMQGGARVVLPPRGPTIYGKTEIDLSVAMGPVPIFFSIDPLSATAPPPQQQLGGAGAGVRATPSPLRASTMPRSGSSLSMGGKGVGGGGESGSVVSNSSAAAAGALGRAPERSSSMDQQGPGGGVIPRANFFPKAPGARPRSRSFSGFNSTSAEILLPLQRSHEVGSKPLAIPTAGEVKESLSVLTSPTSPISSSPPQTSLSAPSSPKTGPRTSPLRPSPLSLSSNSATGGGLRPAAGANPLKSPTSPLAQSITMPPPRDVSPSSVPASPAPSVLSNRPHNLRQVRSRSALQEAVSPRQPNFPRPPISSAGESSGSSPSSPSSFLQGRSASVQAQPATTNVPAGRPSADDDAASVHSSRSQVVSPPPTIVRQTSLRTKLSLPNLRRNRSKQDETTSVTSASQQPDSEMLQVQDMDFELVRPNLARFEAARASVDSGVLGRASIDMRMEHDPVLLRADSPSMSISSGGGASGFSVPRSPIAEGSGGGSWGARSSPSASTTASRVTTDSESSMDAHRQREVKWMSLLSSTPPAQARKSKKVKRLVLEGVPSSVRYLVWSLLTDGKARVVPGVYAQLGARGRVPASIDIERDIQVCFNDQPHLRKTEGPVLALLQAYLTMVPDVHYTRGLTLIAGQLLLLAPEEDAFWIFVSIMDTHVRSYFSLSTTQMEVDSALFSKALESNDAQVGKKILVDMGVTPSTICLPWFSSLFVGSLPPEYLNRVWDIFLYEGVPFLLRVGLAIVSCCRRQILDCTSEELLLAHLRNPSPSWLPPTPEAFLSLTFSIKLKDDDVRKQRIKMEAQVKRQTQVPRMASTSGLISLPRT